MADLAQKDSRENRLGWLHTRQRVVNGLSVGRESFTSGQNEKPCFLRRYLIYIFQYFFLHEQFIC